LYIFFLSCIEKNNDALHASLEALAQECKQPFIRSLFVNSQKEGKVQRGKLTFISVGNKFKTQLEQLMDKLRGTGTNFIRCIKPNVKMVAHQFEGGSILSQLQCAGMTSVLELMQQGYPSRTQFSELYNMYKKYLPPELAKLDPRLFSKALFKALGLDDNDFKFGLTKVFFRPGKFAEFDQLMKADPENLKRLVAKVKKWILASQWKKAMWCALSVIKLKNKILYRRAALIKIQANVRMYLARKQHAPRYKGVARLRKLQSQIEEIGKMSSKLKSGKDGVQANVKHIHAQLDGAIAKIKGSPRIRSTDIDRLNKGLVDLINKEVGNVKDNLQKQKVAEEQERIRKIQEEMEKERKRKVDEEQQKIQMEEDRKLKTEMEVKRKKEEELNLIDQLKKDREEASRLQDSLNEENKRLREQIEQERRDHELALRLAAETNSVVMEDSITPSPTPNSQQLKRSSMVQAQAQARATKKYDLSKWKYAELRDTINTSCDIELLESCREEFHRRLKVYHAWKAKNKKKHTGSNNSSMTVNGNDDIANQNGLQLTFDENMRAPSSILVEAMKNQPNDGVQGRSSINGGEALSKRSMGDGVATNGMNTTERYFRIPFVRPVASNTPGENGNSTPNSITSPSKQAQKGWWYAHFDGDWIGRQMELHPERKPVLLVAGVDDMEMCELALHETGLTRKRGAEILDHEFEKEWIKNGGQPYIRPNRVGK
jgi:myosin-6